jgi:large subunit ribosomal protein L13|tara:strand:- start:185 stop:664 length:480 start_codon:yes stop_codon:yes gene_type:complete
MAEDKMEKKNDNRKEKKKMNEVDKKMKKIIIDAEGAVFGRVCSFVAKKALEGNEMVIVNSEKVVITGNKKDIIGKYDALRKKGGHSQKGPKYSNVAYMMLKKGIRGMLPDHRKGIGKQALNRVRCHNGIPKEFEEEKVLKISAPKKIKSMTLKELSGKI